MATLRVAQHYFILLRKRPPLRTLNAELTPFSHLKVSNGARTGGVLDGILRGATLNVTARWSPKGMVRLLQRGIVSVLEESGDDGVADEHLRFGDSQMVVVIQQ